MISNVLILNDRRLMCHVEIPGKAHLIDSCKKRKRKCACYYSGINELNKKRRNRGRGEKKDVKDEGIIEPL